MQDININVNIIRGIIGMLIAILNAYNNRAIARLFCPWVQQVEAYMSKQLHESNCQISKKMRERVH